MDHLVKEQLMDDLVSKSLQVWWQIRPRLFAPSVGLIYDDFPS